MSATATWRGKPLDNYTKEELIGICIEIAELYDQRIDSLVDSRESKEV